MEHIANEELQQSTSNCTIDELDEYSLLGILSYLKPKDLINTAQVGGNSFEEFLYVFEVEGLYSHTSVLDCFYVWYWTKYFQMGVLVLNKKVTRSMEHIANEELQQSTSNCTIDELDEYSLLGILSYLKPKDLINTAQVGGNSFEEFLYVFEVEGLYSHTSVLDCFYVWYWTKYFQMGVLVLNKKVTRSMEHIANEELQQSTSNCTIDELDEYSLLGILSYLKPKDLINTAQVGGNSFEEFLYVFEVEGLYSHTSVLDCFYVWYWTKYFQMGVLVLNKKVTRSMEHIANEELQQSTSNCTIDELDEYSLLGILSYLKPKDLINTAQVCREWERLSHEAWKNVSKSQFYAFMKEQKTTDDESSIARDKKITSLTIFCILTVTVRRSDGRSVLDDLQGSRALVHGGYLGEASQMDSIVPEQVARVQPEDRSRPLPVVADYLHDVAAHAELHPAAVELYI
ncbi:unnamed protein product [Trichogramma brassicae]|uniref:F-box domain-containing protein n=1 Tax=Trichogramma brassicae TaxID=86971 RepID=A0A6H5J4Q4_9HYME|nr:unnamed protein product [Trichogramma brassicae]